MHSLTRAIQVMWMCWLLFEGIAQATPILDQQNAPSGNFAALTVANDRTQIQTFTVGVTGVLTRIDVQVSRETQTVEDLVLSLWSTDVTGLPKDLLATVSVPPSTIDLPFPRPFVTFDLSAEEVDVFEGELLAIALNSNAPNNPPSFLERYLWEIGGQYDRGTAYTRIGSSLPAHSDDFHFRTYVNPVIPFAAFTAQVEIRLSPRTGSDAFQERATFTLGAASDGINPSTEAVSFQIGTFSTTIPAGSFQAGPRGQFTFEGVINGVTIEVRIAPAGGNRFTFQAEGTDANLTGIANPVTVPLTIGDDSGTTTVTAEIQ
jgi:hypothetical protein